MITIITCLAIILIAVTVIPVLRWVEWWIRGMDFPRLQFSIALMVVFVAQIAVYDFDEVFSWLLSIATLAALVYQLWWIVPYTRFFPHEVKEADLAGRSLQLSIMTANVYMHNRQYSRLLQLLNENDPDVLVTLESDSEWEQALSVIEENYPHTIKCPLDNLYGMHVYSKLELDNTQLEYLVEDDIPSVHAQLKISENVGIRVHFLHPAPPSPTENEESTERDAELMLVAKSLTDYQGPVIVTGDLNDVAWSKTTRLFRKVSGLLDPRVGRGMFNTFNAKYWPIRWPLDHLFHSKHFTVLEMRRLKPFGSDHFALFAKLAVDDLALTEKEGLETEQQGLEAEQEDFEEANEIINAPSVEVGEVPKL